MNTLLKESILATLKYHDIFDYPLTLSEIWRFLIINSNVKCQMSKPQLKTQNLLEKLITEKKIVRKDNFYCLKDREKIIGLRKQKEQYSQQKIAVANKVLHLIKLIPWIKMVGATGALAMNNSTENDDIDLLIITTKNRIWLTRLILILILELLGNRRRPQAKNYKNKICLNMFLDETVLSLSKDKQNLYTAHEIVQMKPILDKDETYKRFLRANLWVKKYLPNAMEIQNAKGKSPWPTAGRQNYNSKFKTNLLITNYSLFDRLNKLAYKLQYKYMKSKMTREQINEHFAFFHPQDRTKEILNKYSSSGDML